MDQELPLPPRRATTLAQPQSDDRMQLGSSEPGSSSRLPRPELPAKWREKRQQVWSAARLHATPTLTAIASADLSLRESSSPGDISSPTHTDLSEGSPLWVELRDDEILSLDGAAPPSESTPKLRVTSMRVARALVWGGAELSRGASALSLPLALFVAGTGLLLASGVQLLVILPAQLLRRGLVRFANGTIRRSALLNRRTRPRLAPSS